MNKEMMKALQMATSKIPLQDLKFTLPFLTNNNLQSKFQQLQHEGYCVLDNVFDTNFISSLREEITIAKEMDAMDINHTHLILPSDETKVFPKHNIYELDSMVKPDLITSDTLKNCNFINTDNTMKQMIDKYIPNLGILNGISPLKLQYNGGNNACFPIHTDASLIVGKPAEKHFKNFAAESTDHRIITAIIYMNDYEPQQGGELRLYPILQDPVDISPIRGRVVLFSSTTMLHRVLPSTINNNQQNNRMCATIWFHGDNSFNGVINKRQNLVPKPLPEDANPVETALFLLQPYYRPFTCRMLYANEWEESIVQSHQSNGSNSEDIDILVDNHDKNVKYIAKTFHTLLPKLNDGLIELQNARLAALHEQKKRTRDSNNNNQNKHPHLRQNVADIGGGGSSSGEDDGEGEEYFPPLPGVLDWLV